MNQAEIDVQMLHVEWAKKVGLVWVYVGINGLRMVDDADKKYEFLEFQTTITTAIQINKHSWMQ